ncbi:MAG: hypothetical protein K1X53_14745 [Candidatus Sumerlaeaceae bacterium]|nr:hypothetical protein [Candidatus Sumerlaeaceae bacterium]
MNTNAIRMLEPFQMPGGIWVFDDPAFGLKREPFVGTINDMIDHFLARKGIPAEQGFVMYFSDRPIPNHDTHLVWEQSDGPECGDWYVCPELNVSGWLCPALLHYFKTPPKDIYVRIEARRKPLTAGELAKLQTEG